MTIAEVEHIHEARRSKRIGNLHEDDYMRLEAKREELEAQNIKVL